MTDKEKYLLLGALAIAGGAYWYFGVHSPAAADIVSQPPVPAGALPGTSQSAVGVSSPPPVGTSTNALGQDTTQLNALLAWSQQTKNPALYAAMINQLSPSDLSGMYNILTTAWNVGVVPSAAQTAFWNGLTSRYPFLKVGGLGCSNFTCS